MRATAQPATPVTKDAVGSSRPAKDGYSLDVPVFPDREGSIVRP